MHTPTSTRSRSLAWPVLLALLAAGCGAGGAQGPPGNIAAPEGEIKITDPDDGDTVDGEDLKITLNVSGFELDERAFGQESEEGRGHLHFSLDGGRYDVSRHTGENGEQAERIGSAGRYTPVVDDTITYQDVPPGPHRLVVTLANNDHSETGVREVVEFRTR